MCLWRGRAAITRSAARDNRNHFVLVYQFGGESCGFFRTSAIVLEHYVDLAPIDAAELIGLRRGHQHAVKRRLTEVGGGTTLIAEVTDLDRAAILLRAAFRPSRTGKSESQDDNDCGQKYAAQLKSL